MTRHLFIFGMGYSSVAIARLAIQHGFNVTGTTRTPEKAEDLARLGMLVQPDLSFPSYPVSHVLSSIPPQPTGDIVLPQIPVGSNARLFYLSTTGVYGDWGGEWVDEESALRPTSDRLRRRVEAEIAWRERGANSFRLAGIYGPGRSVIDDLVAGTARRIDKPGQIFSRIHVEDIAQIVVASMLNRHFGKVYNVCDDEPAPAHEVVAYGARLLGISPPPLISFADANLSPMAQEFYAANRRVRNHKIKQDLGIKLWYPSYREGLAQCLREKCMS